MSKQKTIQEAIQLIKDNDTVGVGGNVLHRAPMALVREVVRAGKRGLKVIKTAGAMDVDVLCCGECVRSVDAGFISYESEFSLADHYRKAVQQGIVKGNEHACYTVMSALRAASYGVPFMPVRGLVISDLIAANDYFTKINDPFSQEEVTVVKAINPDVTILHVHEADVNGNAKIYGPKFDDVLLASASKKIIISTEKIVDTETFRARHEKVDIPHFMVEAVVQIPQGATPCSCDGLYSIDREHIRRFKQVETKEALVEYLQECELIDARR